MFIALIILALSVAIAIVALVPGFAGFLVGTLILLALLFGVGLWYTTGEQQIGRTQRREAKHFR